MPFCPKCGNEVSEEAVFCPSCGASLKKEEVSYRKGRNGGLTALKIVAIIFGGLILIAGIGMLVGGAFLSSARGSIEDSEGFIMSRAYIANVNTHAIVTDEINIHMDIESIRGIWRPLPQDIITIKIEATSNDPSKQVFIGIARQVDVQGYFGPMLYSKVEDGAFNNNPLSGGAFQLSTITHSGEPPTIPPTGLSSWVIAPAVGSGTQALRWNPQTGIYYIAVMNADGSAPVNVTLRVGAKVPFLSVIGNGLIFGGLITIIIGVLLIYVGLRRR